MGLCFSRGEGEGFTIDGGIHVVISKIERGQVTLNVSAPQTVKILRDELVEWEEEHADGEEPTELEEGHDEQGGSNQDDKDAA